MPQTGHGHFEPEQELPDDEYPFPDNDTERMVFAHYVETGRLVRAVFKYAADTGDAGFEVLDLQKFEAALNELMDTATKEMITNLPLESKTEIRRAVEKVLMRQVVLLSPDRKDLLQFLPVLHIQKSVREAMEKFEIDGDKSFDDYYQGNKN